MSDKAFLAHLTDVIAQTTQKPDTLVLRLSPVSGGDISLAYALETNDGRFFLKTNHISNLEIFESERDSLNALNIASAYSVPQVLCIGSFEQKAYIVMEFLELNHHGNQFELGQLLANIHLTPVTDRANYGWKKSNFIGTTPQPNQWKTRWKDFWIENRLLPQLKHAFKNGYRDSLGNCDALLKSVESELASHQPKHALLHGDLWSGNFGFHKQKPVIYDPASYIGDRETDLALTELFGGFNEQFYQGYQKAYPVNEGYSNRKHVYNLYHALNHLNLFGDSYLTLCKTHINKLIR